MKDEIKEKICDLKIRPLYNGILVYDVTAKEGEVIEVQNYITNLQDRMDKAIEYIKNKTKNEVTFDNDKLIDVLKILQGSDE